MKKKSIILIAILTVVLVGMMIFVNAGNSSVKMSKDNLVQVTAPDQEEPMENEMFTIKVYTPPVIEGTNVALDGRVTSNGHTDVYPAAEAINGDAEGGSYWEGPSDQSESVLTLNLKKAYNIHTIRLRLNPNPIWGLRTQTFSIQVSDDGKTYTDLVPSQDFEFDPEEGNEVVLDSKIFKETKAKFVKLTITKNTGAKAGQVAEFEVYTNDK